MLRESEGFQTDSCGHFSCTLRFGFVHAQVPFCLPVVGNRRTSGILSALSSSSYAQLNLDIKNSCRNGSERRQIRMMKAVNVLRRA